MKPALRPLALMISLIGVGAAASAHASVDEAMSAAVITLDDWAPGDGPGTSIVWSVDTPTAVPAVAVVPPRPVVRHQLRRLPRHLAAAPVAKQPTVAIARSERLEVVVASAATCADPVPVAIDHGARVLAMLAGEPDAAPASPPEDGPTKRVRKLAARAALAALAAGVVDVPLPLEDPAHRAAPFGDGAPAVAAATLAGVRGGFSGGGLDVSFGIERAVYINGALVTTTTLNVVSGATGSQAAIAAAAVALVQNGAGNRVAAGALASTTTGTVVQNSLDGQAIRNVTTINATVNSAGLYRGLDLGASLRGAVIDSLRR